MTQLINDCGEGCNLGNGTAISLGGLKNRRKLLKYSDLQQKTVRSRVIMNAFMTDTMTNVVSKVIGVGYKHEFANVLWNNGKIEK